MLSLFTSQIFITGTFEWKYVGEAGLELKSRNSHSLGIIYSNLESDPGSVESSRRFDWVKLTILFWINFLSSWGISKILVQLSMILIIFTIILYCLPLTNHIGVALILQLITLWQHMCYDIKFNHIVIFY